MIKHSFCSPKHEDIYHNDKTCFTKMNLIIIANHLNNVRDFNDKIKKINTKIKKKELYQKIKQTIHMLYNQDIHESQWTSLNFLQKVKSDARAELKKVFRPHKPQSWYSNDKTWLNTYDILNVMTQYENKYSSFKFLGVSPINYDYQISNNQCVANALCSLNVNRLLQLNYSQIGVIFNLDRHDEPGSHWVCFYAGLVPYLKNFGCYYIDSNAIKAPQEVEKLAYIIKEQIDQHYKKNKLKKQFAFHQNTKQFQFKNSECGMFSMFFLIQFLKKCAYKDIIDINIDDDRVHKFRNIYYTP